MDHATSAANIPAAGVMLLQIRLLQFGVRAAPPLPGSTADLIAIKGDVVRTIQVQARAGLFDLRNLPEWFHFVAFVRVRVDKSAYALDQSEIYLVPREALGGLYLNRGGRMRSYLLTNELMGEYFDRGALLPAISSSPKVAKVRKRSAIAALQSPRPRPTFEANWPNV